MTAHATPRGVMTAWHAG